MSSTGRTLFSVIVFAAVASAIPHASRAVPASPSTVIGQSPLVGFWVTGDGDWVVEIAPCISGFCGQLVGLSRSHRPNALRMDAHNPDPAKRDTPLCGLMLLGSFKPSKGAVGKWEDGWIYNPQSGRTYSSQMRLVGSDTLKVRGYVLIPLFGRNETLTRETGPINRCVATPDGRP